MSIVFELELAPGCNEERAKNGSCAANNDGELNSDPAAPAENRLELIELPEALLPETSPTICKSSFPASPKMKSH